MRDLPFTVEISGLLQKYGYRESDEYVADPDSNQKVSLEDRKALVLLLEKRLKVQINRFESETGCLYFRRRFLNENITISQSVMALFR